MNKFNLGKVRGEDGKSATIAIGTVRTGQAGSNASVDNVGDSLRAIFDFTIPRGDKGEKGDRGNEAYYAGSNVQISGGVISATDTTYAPATPAADGLMTSADKVKLNGIATGATKNATDAQLRNRTTHTGEQPISSVTGLQTALDSKVGNDDPRLSNSREWTAAVVSQAEAEAGAASTRRAWTAQRVRQAINAWWQIVTSGFGRNFIAASNEQAARNVLQLGTAATRNVGESSGNVMEVGAFGLGLTTPGPLAEDYDAEAQTPAKIFIASSDTTPSAGDGERGVLNLTFNSAPNQYRGAQLACRAILNHFAMRSVHETGNADWVNLHHTGNILTTTGQSTKYPMTQKATTDAINGISDERDKTEINEIGLGLEVIENLKTFSFKLNKRDWYRQEAAKELIEVEEEDDKVTVQEKINDDVLNAPLTDFEENDGSLKRDDVYTGFIAQDLKETLEELGLDHLGIVKNYAEEYEGGEDRFYIEHLALLPFLVNSIKQLSARIKALEDRQGEGVE